MDLARAPLPLVMGVPSVTKDEAKQWIQDEVGQRQGCKATELISAFLVAVGYDPALDPLALLDELIKEKRLVEVKYTLPTIRYRAKGFLLPSGTVVYPP